MIDHLRVGGKRDAATGSLDAATEIPVTDARRHRNIEVKSELDPALDRLTADQRYVVTLRFLSDFTTAETAEALHKTEDAVKKLQARALVQLRRTIENGRKEVDYTGNGTAGADSLSAPTFNGHEHSQAFGLAAAALAPESRNGASTESLASAPAPEKPNTNGNYNGRHTEAATRRTIVWRFDPAQYEREQRRKAEAGDKIRDLSRREEQLLCLLLPDNPSRNGLNTLRDVAQRLEVGIGQVHSLRRGLLSKLDKALETKGTLPTRLQQALNRLVDNPYYKDLAWTERQQLITDTTEGLGFRKLRTVFGGDETVEIVEVQAQQPAETKRFPTNNRDLSRRELELSGYLFPPADQYPLVRVLRQAEELARMPLNSASTYRAGLAAKLATPDQPETLEGKPRKRELVGRLDATELYAHTTLEERLQIMWFELDKATLEKITAERRDNLNGHSNGSA